jgi:hypothetical protein
VQRNELFQSGACGSGVLQQQFWQMGLLSRRDAAPTEGEGLMSMAFIDPYKNGSTDQIDPWDISLETIAMVGFTTVDATLNGTV